MDDDATQIIEDFNADGVEEVSRKDGNPVGFLKLLKQKNFEETLFPVFEGVCRIGRDIGCHVSVASKTLSKEHCCIETVGDCCFVYDLNSSNKSRRNKVVLTPNVRYELNNNDVLTLADINLVFIKSHTVDVGDSGSETESLAESESMIPVDLENSGLEDGRSVVDRGGEEEKEDDDDEEDGDPSSDILQPTQHQGSHLIGLFSQGRTFAEDSFKEDNEISLKEKGESVFADNTVLETPPQIQRTVCQLATQFIPESESETEDDDLECSFGPSTVTYKTSETNDRKFAGSDEPTQAYMMDFVDEVGATIDPHVTNASCLPCVPAALCNPDLAPTQVFDSSLQISDAADAPTQVFAQFMVNAADLAEVNDPKVTDQINCEAYAGETQVVDETTFPVFFSNQNAPEKSKCESPRVSASADQPTQLFVEETQPFETLPIEVVEDLPTDKRFSLPKRSCGNESGGLAINFSPQSASTQVFPFDGNSSFVPSLILETSDLEDHSAAKPTVASLDAKTDACTNDMCTQIYSETHEVESEIKEPSANSDELCTQVYNSVEDNIEMKNSEICSDVCKISEISKDTSSSLGSEEVRAHTSPLSHAESEEVRDSDATQSFPSHLNPQLSSSTDPDKAADSDGTDLKNNPGNTDDFATQVFSVSPVKYGRKKNIGMRTNSGKKTSLANKKRFTKVLDSSENENLSDMENTEKKSVSKISSNENLVTSTRKLKRIGKKDADEENTKIPRNEEDTPSADDNPIEDQIQKMSSEIVPPEASPIGTMEEEIGKSQKSRLKSGGRKNEITPCDPDRRTSTRQSKAKYSEDDYLMSRSSIQKKPRGNKRKPEVLEVGEDTVEVKKPSVDSKSSAIPSAPSASEDNDSQISKGTKDLEVVDSSQMSDDSLPTLASLLALNSAKNQKLRNELFPLVESTGKKPSDKPNCCLTEKDSGNTAKEDNKEHGALSTISENEPLKVCTSDLTKTERKSLSVRGIKSSKAETSKSNDVESIGHESSLPVKTTAKGRLEKNSEDEFGQNNVEDISGESADDKNIRGKTIRGRKSSVLKGNSRSLAVNRVNFDGEETGKKSEQTPKQKRSPVIDSSHELQIVCDPIDTKVAKTGSKKKLTRKTVEDGFTGLIESSEHKTVSSKIVNHNEDVSSNLVDEELETVDCGDSKGPLSIAIGEFAVETDKVTSDRLNSSPVVIGGLSSRKSRRETKNAESSNVKTDLSLSAEKQIKVQKRTGKRGAKPTNNETPVLNVMSNEGGGDDKAGVESEEIMPNASKKRQKTLASSNKNSETEDKSDKTAMGGRASPQDVAKDVVSVGSSVESSDNDGETKLVSLRKGRRNLLNQAETMYVAETSSATINVVPVVGQKVEAASEKSASKLSMKKKSRKATDVDASESVHALVELPSEIDTKIGRREKKSRVRSRVDEASSANVEDGILDHKTGEVEDAVDLQQHVKENINSCAENRDGAGESKASAESKRKYQTKEETITSKAKSKDSPAKIVQQTLHPDISKAKRRTKSSIPVELAFKPKVMFTGVVDENGQKSVKSLGGEMIDSIYDCTHLVTDQVRRTVKFLCGVARGIPVVSPKWLEESLKAGKFLDAFDFLVSDAENEKKFNFSLSKTLQQAAKQPLLLGLNIHVTENVRPDPKQMKDIIQCAGGKFLPEAPKSFEKDVIIVTCDGKDLTSCCRLEEMGFPVVSSEYIMTGVLQHKLDAEVFQLTSKKTSVSTKRSAKETLTGTKKKQRK